MSRAFTGEAAIVEREPSVEEYQRLRRAVGWSQVSDEAAGAGLPRSLYSVCAVRSGEVIGCGRVVGDGGLYFYIQDIMVLPEFQGQGIGHKLMDSVMRYIEARAMPGAFIGLMAAKGYAGFYERYGFRSRPTDAPGMSLSGTALSNRSAMQRK